MIHLIADERHACAHAHGELTVGSRGIPVQVGLSDDFDGLAVTICFQAGTERAEVVWYEGEEINVPPQCLTKEGERLLVGVYGAKADGTVVIPTIWATAGIVKRGTDLTGASPLDPEPDWTAQVQSIAAEAIETANAVKAAADAGEFDGYSPSASVTNSGDTATITITDKDGTTHASIRDGYDTSGSVVQDGTTAIITLTDHDGTTRAEVHDGISPSASVAQTETGATVTVTDRSGTTTAQLTNGATGPQGERGPAGPKGDTGDGALDITIDSLQIVVPCNANGVTERSFYRQLNVWAYSGLTPLDITVNVSQVPSWMMCNIVTIQGRGVLTLQCITGTSVSQRTFSVMVQATKPDGGIESRTFLMDVLPVYDGADGEDGYSFVAVNGTFVPVHTNPDDTTRAGVHYLIFEAYRGSEKLDVTSVTFSGPSWITASHNNHGMLTLRWPDGENFGGSANCGITATVDDHGTTRTEQFPIVVGAVKDGADGISPTVTVQPITGGHEVTVTDAGGSQSFDVMDGKDGQKLTKSISGTLLTAADSYAAPPVDVTVYGVSTQGGTPTPSAPVPILSVDALTLHAGDGTTDATGWPVAIDLQGHELRSLPNGTRDELVIASDGSVTLVQRVGALTLVGSESWTKASSTKRDIFMLSLQHKHVNNSTCNVMCNRYAATSRNGGSSATTQSMWSNMATQISFYNGEHTDTTAAQFKTWLASNNVEILYALTEPQTIALGTVTLPTLPAPDATVWADGGSATPSLSLTYERDLGIVIANLEAAIADLATS